LVRPGPRYTAAIVMSYTVLARKYRPQTFADLVGQEHVTRTLANAITSGRVAHAFLFTGVRGVGKTTSARILAKALNCETGPTPSPCNVCTACQQITLGTDLDVIEMDGASNNSVEDVRRLQESIPFRPARGRFKIVIVDEVHMLSTGAFNAFLKTLEEPPAHVKFIFATTESHKLPVTIRSRCQRYDFRLIPQTVIAERVKHILAAEQIEADADAVAIVAREAQGSMRDALTLLDQVVAFSGEKLLGREVSERLGIADREHVYAMMGSVLEGNGKAALEVVDAVATQGIDLLHFTRQWLDLTRDMVVLRVAEDAERLVELTPDERARALALAGTVDVLELQRLFAFTAKLVDDVARASAPRMALEMGAVRLATRPKLRDLGELLSRLERLERSTGPEGAGGGGRAQGPAGRGAPGPGRPPEGPRAEAPRAAEPQRHAEPQRPSEAPRSAEPPRAPAPGGPAPIKHAFERFIPPEVRDTPSPSGQDPHSAYDDKPRPSAGLTGGPAAQLLSAASPAIVPAAGAAGAAVAARIEAPPARLPPSKPSPQARELLTAYRKLVERMRAEEPRWAAMFEHGVPTELSATRVEACFPEGSFFGRQAQSPPGLHALQAAADFVLGPGAEVNVRFGQLPAGVSLAQLAAQEVDERKEAIKRRVLLHPRILEALKVFPELAQKQDIQVD
jgi:DNA polymerase-3 subunit gamma/tau